MTQSPSSTKDFDLAPFLTLRRHLKVAHHIPGRIRLRIAAAVIEDLGKVDGKVFDRILHAIDGIKDVRLNALAGSIVISYTPARIEPAWWETLVHGEDATAIALLHRLLGNELAPAVEAARRH